MARKDTTPDIGAMIAAAVQDALASALPGAPGNPRDTAAPAKPKGKGTTRKATRKAPASCITAGEAWIALGSDEQYQPRDPEKPATNGQLWSLNAAGRLTLK